MIIQKANADLLIKRPILSWYVGFPLVYAFLNIHRWFSITYIIPHSPNDG